MTSLSPLVGSPSFTCRRSESVFAAVEKCLDNGAGVCFVVDEQQNLVGRITLDDIRRAILDGAAIRDTSLDQYITLDQPRDVRLRPGAALWPSNCAVDVVTPVVDTDGKLADVKIDRTKKFIQVAKPDLSHREFRAVLDAFISSWISNKGPYVPQFESEFASYIDQTHAVAVTNGTVALHLALLALGVGPGDEVIVPDLTFAATLNAVLYCGATPILADVDPVTWTLTAELVEKLITPRTKAVVPVHLYGRPAEIGPIMALAKERGLVVVEDCAEAHGAKYAGRAVGGFGDVSCFSFYANKIVTTGEGGMCLTASAALHDVMTEQRDHGVAASRAYWHDRVGYNYHMTNLQAAIGLAQIWRIDQTLNRNSHLDQLYRKHLAPIPGVTFPPDLPAIYEPVVWLVCAQVPAESRARLIDELRRRDIELRPFFNCMSTMPPYEKYGRHCPTSMALSATGVNLPTSSDVDEDVVEKIASIFRDVLG